MKLTLFDVRNITKAFYTKKTVLISFLFAGIIVASCNKSTTLPSQVTPPTTSTTDIYISGDSIAPSGKLVAVYWKNDIPIGLTNGLNNSGANSISVIGSDVYVAGFTTAANGKSVATYLKNSIPVYLTDSSSNATATSIFVSGTDVYVAG